MRTRTTAEQALADHGADCKCSNCAHARSVEAAIEAFARKRRLETRGDMSCIAADLISGLGHYCELHGLDFIMIAQRGISAWRAALEEPDGHSVAFTAKVSITPTRVV
jgi:hypothetical protein